MYFTLIAKSELLLNPKLTSSLLNVMLSGTSTNIEVVPTTFPSLFKFTFTSPVVPLDVNIPFESIFPYLLSASSQVTSLGKGASPPDESTPFAVNSTLEFGV